MIELASNGTAYYRVAVPGKMSPQVEFAASELVNYLRDLSGAGFSMTIKGGLKTIMLVEGDLSGLALSMNLPVLKGEQWGVFMRGDTICLLGGNDRALVYAVYDFLHALGCRWPAPDYSFYEGRSKSIPVSRKLIYTHAGDKIKTAAFKYRKFYIEEGLSHNAENLMQLLDWMPKLKYNILVIPIDYQGKGRVTWDKWRRQFTPELRKRGIMIEVGGHGYQNFLNAKMENGKLHEQHPEWFGMDEKGRRSRQAAMVFCTSNSDAIKYLHNNISKYLAEHPEIDIFDFWPPDGERWCVCEKCKVEAPEERHSALVSKTAQFLKNTHPSVKVECIAYSKYLSPPKKEIMNKDVLVDFCPINQSFASQIYDKGDKWNMLYADSLAEWIKTFEGDVSIYSYYRKYLWRSLPAIIPHYMQNDMRYFLKSGAKGISIYSEPGDWFAYGPNYYVFGHLAQDAEADVDLLMKEYSEGVFGEASAVMLRVYGDLEEIVRHGTRFPFTPVYSVARYDEYLVRIAKCVAEVESAKSRIDDQAIQGHLARVLLMLRYVAISIGERRETAAIGKPEIRSQIRKQVRDLLEAHDDKGIFIIRKARQTEGTP